MNVADNINSVIDTLCEKFGIAFGEAQKLVPEIINYGRASSTVITILTGMILLTGLAMILFAYRRCIRRRSRSDAAGVSNPWFYLSEGGADLNWVVVLGVISLAAGFFSALINGMSCLRWWCAPNLAVIEYITKMLTR